MASRKTEEVKETKKEEKVDLENIKKELTDYIDEKMRYELVDNIEKANKRVIREKNIKILCRDILIVVLLGICGFLVYTLYNINYFDFDVKDNNNNKNDETKEVEEKEPKEEVVVEPTLDELKAKYAYLLNGVVINEDSTYIKDYYDGKLTDELKNYIALNNMDFSELRTQDDYNIINEYGLNEKYKEIFDSEFKTVNFDFNGNNIRYIDLIKSYLSTSVLEHTKTNIKREITDIKVSDDKVIITTVEGLIKDNKLYNILDNTLIEEYEDSLLKCNDKLNKITYVFKNNKLIDLEK